MKRILIYILITLCAFSSAQAQEVSQDVSGIKQDVATLQKQNDYLKKAVRELTRQNNKAGKRISALQGDVKSLNLQVDSLNKQLSALSVTQKTDNETLTVKLGETKQDVQTNQQQLSARTTWGIVSVALLLAVICAIVLLFLRKFKTGTTSIDEVRKAQDALRNAQTKMQEESIRLDNQLLELLDKQLQVINDNKTTTQSIQAEPDHSLVIKLANEIAKIETNLSKMDKSVRGYKQLVQAKDKMINNVTAYGYEIISLIGQEYNDGMQFPARFVPDESLEEGKRIITGMVKMQVNYNGKMIQAAEIVVNQNI